MRTLRLILLRHAETQVQSVSGEDHERALTARGQRDALAVGPLLASRGLVPELGLASDALRAHTTATLAGKVWASCPWQIHPDLYLASASDLADTIIAQTPPSVSTLLLVGHNPGLSELVSTLTACYCVLAPAEAACCEVKAQTWEEALDALGTWKLCASCVPSS